MLVYNLLASKVSRLRCCVGHKPFPPGNLQYYMDTI